MNEKEAEAINRLKNNSVVLTKKMKDVKTALTVEQFNDLGTVFNLVTNLETEIEKKDKIINSIKEYAQQEIDFATEDIEDYIDDDREGNKDIIGELKEWREHWKDIIRIMNNEKTYMDFEYKV